jgi:hypothetical protein
MSSVKWIAWVGPMVAVAVLFLTAANIPANYTLRIDVSQFPGADFGAKMAACDAYVTATSAAPAICDATRLTGSQTWNAGTTLVSSNIVFLTGPNTTVVKAPGQQIAFSGNNVAFLGSGNSTVYDGQAWTSGSNGEIAVNGHNHIEFGNFKIIGDRIASGDVPADGAGSNCLTVTASQDIFIHDMYLLNCGNLGISMANDDRTLTRDVLIEQASDSAYAVSSSNGSVHRDNKMVRVTSYDSNTSKHAGTGQFNITSTGGIGQNIEFVSINSTVLNEQSGRTGGPCNQSVTLSARTGCGQGLQITDSINEWRVEGLTVRDNSAEALAIGGFDGEVSGGNFDHISQGAAGAGCILIYSAKQVVTGYINIHDINCTDSGYGVELDLGQTAVLDGNIFGPIHIHHNNFGTIVDTMLVGIRDINSTCSAHTATVCNGGAGNCGGGARACNYTIRDVQIDHNNFRDVATPFAYTIFNGGASKEGLTGYWLTESNLVGNSGTGYIYDCKISGASPLQCGSAETGTVTIAAGATTVTVNDTQVTAHSTILITEQPGLGSQLTPTVTGNTTAGRTYTVTAQTEGVSFVVTASAAPVTNPAVISFRIVN